ncbi:MAG: flagellar motor protein MotB [Terriglobales bacterium]
MRRRKRSPSRVSRVSHERWLISYADFITLLFAFFVVLYAASQVDKKKAGMLAVAIQAAFQQMGVFPPGTTQAPIDATKPIRFSIAQAMENPATAASLGRIASRTESPPGAAVDNEDLNKLQTELEAALGPEFNRKEIAMRRAPDGLVISLREMGFFESGAARMKSASQDAFDRIAGILRQRDYRLRIEGHTDNTPIHTPQFPSNWELGTSRATETVRLLIVREGFSPDRLSAAGYAQYHPVATNLTPEGRGMNRRVDIVILGHVLTADRLAQDESQAQTPAAAPAEKKTAQPSAPAALKPAVVRNAGDHLQLQQ